MARILADAVKKPTINHDEVEAVVNNPPPLLELKAIPWRKLRNKESQGR